SSVFFKTEVRIRYLNWTGVQTCSLPYAADAQASGTHGSDAHGVYRYDDSAGETTQVIPPTGGGGHGGPPQGGDGRPRRVGIAIVIAALVLGLIGGIGGAAALRGVAGGDSFVS